MIENCPFLCNFENTFYNTRLMIDKQKEEMSQNKHDIYKINRSFESKYYSFISISNDKINGYLSFEIFALGFGVRINFLYGTNEIFNELMSRFISYVYINGFDFIEIEAPARYYTLLLNFGFIKSKIIFDDNGDFKGIDMIKKLI